VADNVGKTTNGWLFYYFENLPLSISKFLDPPLRTEYPPLFDLQQYLLCNSQKYAHQLMGFIMYFVQILRSWASFILSEEREVFRLAIYLTVA
jgi:hypothetical protein